MGRKKWIEKCRRHPLYRALRLDKMILAGLEATLQMHLEDRSHELPAWEYLERSAEQCKQLALEVAEGLNGVDVVPSVSFVGGGALPDQALETWVVKIVCKDVEEMARQLRVGTPAVMARVQKNAIWIDVRTVDLSEKADLKHRLSDLLKNK